MASTSESHAETMTNTPTTRITAGAGIALLALLATPAPGLASERAAIDAVLDALHGAASAADGDRYFSLFADDAVFIGTDPSERWTLAEFREYARPHFDEEQGWTYVPTERQVTVGPHGKTAWFHELLDNDKYGLARGTGVLVKEESGWKIAQYHLAFPIPNELSREITGRIKEWRNQEER